MKNSVWNAVEERFQKYAKGERKKGVMGENGRKIKAEQQATALPRR